MISVRQRSFIDLWQMLYHDSKPSADATFWSIDGIEWSRESHSFQGKDYSFRVETHRLRSPAAGKARWALLVVTEQWSAGETGKPIKYQRWCQITEGQKRQVFEWFSRQRTKLEAR